MTEVTPEAKPVDLIFAVLAVLLVVLGAILIVTNPTERPAPRVPVIAPVQLVTHFDTAREG